MKKFKSYPYCFSITLYKIGSYSINFSSFSHIIPRISARRITTQKHKIITFIAPNNIKILYLSKRTNESHLIIIAINFNCITFTIIICIAIVHNLKLKIQILFIVISISQIHCILVFFVFIIRILFINPVGCIIISCKII